MRVFVVYRSTGTCLCKFCSISVVLQRVCADFVVYGSTGTCLRELCSIR